MSSDPKQVVRLQLSDSQKRQVMETTGRHGECLELTVEELEQRITPRLAANHNETMLSWR